MSMWGGGGKDPGSRKRPPQGDVSFRDPRSFLGGPRTRVLGGFALDLRSTHHLYLPAMRPPFGYSLSPTAASVSGHSLATRVLEGQLAS